MRCVRCGWPSKNYEMSNDGRPAAHPYARLDAAYLLGALDADERLAYEAHLAICLAMRQIADLCSRRDKAGPVSQGRWLVSLTRWTAASPQPCHWISLMQAEPRYSR